MFGEYWIGLVRFGKVLIGFAGFGEVWLGSLALDSSVKVWICWVGFWLGLDRFG